MMAHVEFPLLSRLKPSRQARLGQVIPNAAWISGLSKIYNQRIDGRISNTKTPSPLSFRVIRMAGTVKTVPYDTPICRAIGPPSVPIDGPRENAAKTSLMRVAKHPRQNPAAFVLPSQNRVLRPKAIEIKPADDSPPYPMP